MQPLNVSKPTDLQNAINGIPLNNVRSISVFSHTKKKKVSVGVDESNDLLDKSSTLQSIYAGWALVAKKSHEQMKPVEQVVRCSVMPGTRLQQNVRTYLEEAKRRGNDQKSNDPSSSDIDVDDEATVQELTDETVQELSDDTVQELTDNDLPAVLGGDGTNNDNNVPLVLSGDEIEDLENVVSDTKEKEEKEEIVTGTKPFVMTKSSMLLRSGRYVTFNPYISGRYFPPAHKLPLDCK